MLVIATPDPVQARKMVDVAQQLNPGVEIVLRTHTEEEADLLRQENAGKVFMGEHGSRSRWRGTSSPGWTTPPRGEAARELRRRRPPLDP